MPRLSRFLSLFVLPAVLAAQPYGTVALPPELAGAGAAVEWVQPVASFCEGPAWDGAGSIYFTEQRGRDTDAWPIWKVDLAGEKPAGRVFLEKSEQANGLAFDPQGRLVACQRRKVSRIDAAGKMTALADSTAAIPFGYANDLTFASDGSLWFTALDSRVFRVDAQGNLQVAASGFQGANGVLFDEAAGVLYVADAPGAQVVRFRVGADGALSERESFAKVVRPDGLALDARGNLYAACNTQGRVRVFSPAGDSLGSILMSPASTHDMRRGPGGNASNCGFGGAGLRTLFITGDGGLYAVRLQVAGRDGPGTVALSRPVRREPRDGRVLRILRAGTQEGRRAGPILLGRRTGP